MRKKEWYTIRLMDLSDDKTTMMDIAKVRPKGLAWLTYESYREIYKNQKDVVVMTPE